MTADQVAQIHELRAAGLSQQKIAEQVGCSQITVSRELDPRVKAHARAQARAWRETHRDRRREHRRRAQQKMWLADGIGRRHHEARLLVGREIAAGRLERQPCEVCGAAEVHAHHEDYSKPLDVRWLCPEHHREVHA